MHSEQNTKCSKRSGLILILWGISIMMVIYYSVIPAVEAPVDFWNADKAYHLLAYVLLAVLPMLALVKRSLAFSAAFSMIILGSLLEIIQYFIPDRSFSLMDILANILGVILGVCLGLYLRAQSAKNKNIIP